MSDIYIENYSEASIVVLGDTKTHKEQLKKLGGKFNSKLREEKVGWIFSKKNEANVRAYIDKGELPTSSNLEERVAFLEKEMKRLISKLGT